MSREALVLLVCCCDFRDGAERLISSKSLRNAVIRAFPGLFRILRMCAPRRAAAVVRPRGREKSADRRRRILISRLLIIRASVPRRKSPFPAYFKGFPAVSPLIPPYPAFLKYPVSPQQTSSLFSTYDIIWITSYFVNTHFAMRRKRRFPIPCVPAGCGQRGPFSHVREWPPLDPPREREGSPPQPPTLAVSILKNCSACGIGCSVHGFAMNLLRVVTDCNRALLS